MRAKSFRNGSVLLRDECWISRDALHLARWCVGRELVYRFNTLGGIELMIDDETIYVQGIQGHFEELQHS